MKDLGRALVVSTEKRAVRTRASSGSSSIDSKEMKERFS